MMFSLLTSCSTPISASVQDDMYIESYENVVVRSDVDFSIVIRYGTPYYFNGSLLYYLYNGLYYYPYFYDNYWYVRAYRKPFYYIPNFRPHRYDYRFSPGVHKGYNRPPIQKYRPIPTRPNTNIRPPMKPVQPSRRPPMRPNIPNRSGGPSRR